VHRFNYPSRSDLHDSPIAPSSRYLYFFNSNHKFLPESHVDQLVLDQSAIGSEVVRSEFLPVVFGLVL
jgi:hypothetical protein